MPRDATYTLCVEDSSVGVVGVDKLGDDFSAAPAAQSSKSRVNLVAEQAALGFLRRDDPQQALKVLMRAYASPLAAYARGQVRDAEQAKDISQQVFLEAFQSFSGFQARGTLWSWLCGIAYHRCLDEWRRRSRKPALLSETGEDLDDVPSPQVPNPDKDRVARGALEACLSRLKPEIRSQVLMKHQLGFSFVEIAEIVGDEPGTVQVRISRIMPKLKHCLRSKGAWT